MPQSKIFQVKTNEKVYPNNLFHYIEIMKLSDDENGVNYLSNNQLSENQMKGMNYILSSVLNNQEQKILKMRFQDRMTVKEISIYNELTVTRIEQVIRKACKKISSPSYIHIIITGEILKTENRDLSDIHIDELILSPRLSNALKRHKVYTIKDLIPVLEDYLLNNISIRNLGVKTYNELIEKVEKFGLNRESIIKNEISNINFSSSLKEKLNGYYEMAKSQQYDLSFPANLIKAVAFYPELVYNEKIDNYKLNGIQFAVNTLNRVERDIITYKYLYGETDLDIVQKSSYTLDDIFSAHKMALRKLYHPYRFKFILNGLDDLSTICDVKYVDIAELDMDVLNSIDNNLFNDLDNTFVDCTIGMLKNIIESSPNNWFNEGTAYLYLRRIKGEKNRKLIRYLISINVLDTKILEKLE